MIGFLLIPSINLVHLSVVDIFPLVTYTLLFIDVPWSFTVNSIDELLGLLIVIIGNHIHESVVGRK